MDKWHIASVSFGKDSLAMLLLLLSKQWEGQYPLDEVIFFDWGMEFQAIYNNRDKIIPILQEKGIKFTQLTYPTSFMYNFCEKEVHKKNGTIQNGYSWCGGRTRWGTDRKNSTIKKYYKTSFPYKNYTYKGTSYGTVEDLEYRFHCEDTGIDFTL